MGKCNNDEFWDKLFQPVTWMLICIVNKMIECHIFLYIISNDIIQPLN